MTQSGDATTRAVRASGRVDTGRRRTLWRPAAARVVEPSVTWSALDDWFADGPVRVPGAKHVRAPHTAPEPAGEPTAQPRIVIVDDNDDVRRLVRIQIERLKAYDVVGEACDGAEAIEVVTLHRPDVVVLDLAMPGMDGLEALPHILSAVPDVRVVVLSASDRSIYEPKVMAAGAALYVEKAIRVDFADVLSRAMWPR